MPEIASVRGDAQTGANTVGRPAFPPRPLRSRGRMFRRSVGIVPPRPARDETGSGHGATPPGRLSAAVWLDSQEPLVWVAAAIEVDADASELVCA